MARATATTIRWKPAPSALARALETHGARLVAALHALCEVFAARIEAYAKINAPWRDRTAAARQGLRAWVESTTTRFVITLAHGVFYGIFLELSRGGRYAIISTTLEAHYAGIMEAVRRLVDG